MIASLRWPRRPPAPSSWGSLALGAVLLGLALAAGCGVELAWTDPAAGTELPSPSAFLLASAVVLCALVGHAFAVYGGRRAARLVLAVSLLAVLKERSNPADEYMVLLPHRLPFAVAGGWLVTVLLSLDFARRVQHLLWPGRPARVLPQVLLMGIFAWQLSLAIEPLGQAAGWWSWTEEVRQGRFPVADTGGPWLVMTCFFGGWGLVAATRPGRRLRVALGLMASSALVVAGTLVTAIPVVGALAVGASILALRHLPWRAGGPELDPALSPWFPAPGVARWVDGVPFASLVTVCWTLTVYALQLDVPGWQGSVTPVLILGAASQIGRLGAAQRPVRRRGAALRARSLALRLPAPPRPVHAQAAAVRPNALGSSGVAPSPDRVGGPRALHEEGSSPGGRIGDAGDAQGAVAGRRVGGRRGAWHRAAFARGLGGDVDRRDAPRVPVCRVHPRRALGSPRPRRSAR